MGKLSSLESEIRQMGLLQKTKINRTYVTAAQMSSKTKYTKSVQSWMDVSPSCEFMFFLLSAPVVSISWLFVYVHLGLAIIAQFFFSIECISLRSLFIFFFLQFAALKFDFCANWSSLLSYQTFILTQLLCISFD